MLAPSAGKRILEEGVHHEVSKIFGCVEHLDRAGGIFAGTSFGGRWHRPELCGGTARL